MSSHTYKNATKLFAIAACVLLCLSACGKGSTSSQETITWEGETEAIVGNSSSEVSTILANAEKYAYEDDYETAYTTVNDGLMSHPSSTELQEKCAEYKRNRDDIEDILDRAESNAASGSFDRALEVLSTGLTAYPNSQKLKNANEDIAKRKDAATKEEEKGDTSIQVVYAPAPTDSSDSSDSSDSKKEQEETSSYTFPQHWSGSYLGNTIDEDGENVSVQRMVWFDLSETNGQLSGTCSVGMDDGSNNVDGTFRVSGSYNHQTGEITINGTEWVNQGDLWGMRNFWGTVDASMRSMSGRCVGTSSGKEGDWSATAN